jgi:hypothetical protein
MDLRVCKAVGLGGDWDQSQSKLVTSVDDKEDRNNYVALLGIFSTQLSLSRKYLTFNCRSEGSYLSSKCVSFGCFNLILGQPL